MASPPGRASVTGIAPPGLASRTRHRMAPHQGFVVVDDRDRVARPGGRSAVRPGLIGQGVGAASGAFRTSNPRGRRPPFHRNADRPRSFSGPPRQSETALTRPTPCRSTHDRTQPPRCTRRWRPASDRPRHLRAPTFLLQAAAQLSRPPRAADSRLQAPRRRPRRSPWPVPPRAVPPGMRSPVLPGPGRTRPPRSPPGGRERPLSPPRREGWIVHRRLLGGQLHRLLALAARQPGRARGPAEHRPPAPVVEPGAAEARRRSAPGPQQIDGDEHADPRDDEPHAHPGRSSPPNEEPPPPEYPPPPPGEPPPPLPGAPRAEGAAGTRVTTHRKPRLRTRRTRRG